VPGLHRARLPALELSPRTQADDGHEIRAHAAARPRFGYRRIPVLLRRGGWRVNHKRVYRIYRAEGLAVRRRRRKRMAVGMRTVLPPPNRPNERWSMDFTLDTLASGRRFRTLNVVDDFTRECLVVEVDTSLGGTRVVRVLERLLAGRDRPVVIVCDNGPEFGGETLDAWAYAAGVRIRFIRPGKPVENCYIESFNGKFRDECLNHHWFPDLDDARTKIEDWRRDHNEVRPHSSLGDLTPEEFINRRTRSLSGPALGSRSVLTSLWPRSCWMVRMSEPDSRRWVANECLRVWGDGLRHAGGDSGATDGAMENGFVEVVPPNLSGRELRGPPAPRGGGCGGACRRA